LAIYKPFSGGDVEVRVRLKPMSGKLDRSGGIAVRLTTPDDYYVATASALSNIVAFYRVLKGKRDQLGSATAKVSANEWHALTLKAQGDRFTISLDGTVLLTVTDATINDAGKVALWTHADSITRFEQLEMLGLPKQEAR
jgi:hypothetical protein